MVFIQFCFYCWDWIQFLFGEWRGEEKITINTTAAAAIYGLHKNSEDVGLLSSDLDLKKNAKQSIMYMLIYKETFPN
jgi:hypothetical protein